MKHLKHSAKQDGIILMSKTEIFLDSGAWSAHTQNTTIDIDTYIEYIRKNQHLLTTYANLDIVNDGEASYQNWLHMRKAGLDPMPVYHAETDEKYLKHYLKESHYIAIGAIAAMTTSKRLENLDYIWFNYLVDDKLMPTHKFHGFGLTSLKILFRYPWYSVDSTSWVAFSRFGIILIPEVIQQKYKYDRPPRTICVSRRSPSNKKAWATIHNMNPKIRKKIIRYARNLGFPMGKSQITSFDDGKVQERVLVPGLSNDHKLRDQFNLLFFVKAEEDLGHWRQPLNINFSKTKQEPLVNEDIFSR